MITIIRTRTLAALREEVARLAGSAEAAREAERRAVEARREADESRGMATEGCAAARSAWEEAARAVADLTALREAAATRDAATVLEVRDLAIEAAAHLIHYAAGQYTPFGGRLESAREVRTWLEGGNACMLPVRMMAVRRAIADRCIGEKPGRCYTYNFLETLDENYRILAGLDDVTGDEPVNCSTTQPAVSLSTAAPQAGPVSPIRTRRYVP